MSDGIHLLIPFASCRAEGCRQVLDHLVLPRLEALLSRLSPEPAALGDEASLSTPHERVLARELGMPVVDGQIPLAAWQARQAGLPGHESAWARLTPSLWRVGSDHVALMPPGQLHLTEAESRALLSVMRPFFEEDGIALWYQTPTLWLAKADVFADFPAASLDRVAGGKIDDWMPRTAQARAVRRLQQEMQMLLYIHEISEARERLGQPPVNSFWVSDTGTLGAEAREWPQGLQWADDLREPALEGRWDAWAAAWVQLDARAGSLIQDALAASRPVTLTLCGERHSQSWSNARPRTLASRVSGWFDRVRAGTVLKNL